MAGAGNSWSPKSYKFLDGYPLSGTAYYRLKQIDDDGSVEYSNIVEILFMKSPEVFVLLQNYPNPFNPITVIKWQLPAPGRARLSIYDVLGNEIVLLVDEQKEAGIYEAEFDGTHLGSGMYFYTLSAGGKTLTRKMLLIK